MHVHIYIYIYIYIYVYLHMCIYIYMYIHVCSSETLSFRSFWECWLHVCQLMKQTVCSLHFTSRPAWLILFQIPSPCWLGASMKNHTRRYSRTRTVTAHTSRACNRIYRQPQRGTTQANREVMHNNTHVYIYTYIYIYIYIKTKGVYKHSHLYVVIRLCSVYMYVDICSHPKARLRQLMFPRISQLWG